MEKKFLNPDMVGNPNIWGFLQWLVERYPHTCLFFLATVVIAYLWHVHQNQTHTRHVLINLVEKGIPFLWEYRIWGSKIQTYFSRPQGEEAKKSI